MVQPLSDRARFGPFELNVRSGELHCDGRTIVLTEQVFQVLVILIEHDGEIATREEIRNQLRSAPSGGANWFDMT